MRPPDFLKVLPADIGRVGSLGACILALVRYVTSLPGEANGRMSVDGETWWRASQDEIGHLLGGVHRKSVGRALLKLETAGELLTRPPAETFYGDRAQAYRAPDQPLDESGQSSDQPLDECGQSSGRMWPSSWDESGQAAGTETANLPLLENFEEHSVGENARATEDEPLDVETVPDHRDAPPPPDSSDEEPQPLDAEEVEPASRELVTQRIDGTDAIVGEVVADDPDPEPQPYCNRHMPHGTDNSCGACGHRRRTRETWQQRQQARLLMSAFSKAAEPAQPVRRQPEPKPEPPAWVPGPDGRPRCRRHGHLPTAPVDCTQCRDAAMAAGESV